MPKLTLAGHPLHPMPGDERVEHALHDVERYAPSSGPMLH